MRRKDGFTGTLIIFLLGTSFAIGGLVGGVLGGALVLWAVSPHQQAAQVAPAPPQPPTPMPTPTTTVFIAPTPTPTAVIIATPSTEDVIDSVLPAVVTIVNQKIPIAEGSLRITGSGIVVDAAGYVVTNAHVVADAQTLTVILADGSITSAETVIVDEDQDLALLKIAVTEPLTAIKWGDSNTVRLGQPVLALGSPLGDFPNSVTMGIVSGLQRTLELDGVRLYGLIQTDAAINQGNSGGPLVNLQGEVVGINTVIIRAGDRQSVAEGIGFAIPASAAKLLSTAWMADIPPNAASTQQPPANTAPLPAAQSDGD